MFHIGMKVVCVADQNQAGKPPYAVKGGVYEITGIDAGYRGQLGLNFAELQMEREYFLYAWRFRPVVSRKTDISEFTKMLTDERLPDLVVLHKLLERT